MAGKFLWAWAKARNYSTSENSQQKTQSIGCIFVSNSTDRAINGDSVFVPTRTTLDKTARQKTKKPQIHFFPKSISWYSNCILELIKTDSRREIHWWSIHNCTLLAVKFMSRARHWDGSGGLAVLQTWLLFNY